MDNPPPDQPALQPESPERGLGSFLYNSLVFGVQLVFILAASYVAFDWLMESFIHTRKEVEVPDLKGKSLQQAVDALSHIGMAISKESDEYAPDIPVGIVLKQYPLAKSNAREGKIVRVVLSLGSEKMAVPELIGLPIRKAEIEIRSAQLVLGETSEVYSIRHPKGHVVDQEPKPLSLVEKGELMNLVISQGEPPPDQLIIPDFTNKDAQEAESWAKENGVKFKVIEEWQAEGAMDRSVLRQNLKPDTVLERDEERLSKMALEVTIARSAADTADVGYLEYTLPIKPNRPRELILKMLTKEGERQIHKSKASPGEKVRMPVNKSWLENQLRVRIYLDGVFTEEKVLR
ncbi:MAG: PASTA domain-containing protein [Elusimicrobia bacterium]|nr:PASTA domain-containing protein [Elusimicrobiota bacterium]